MATTSWIGGSINGTPGNVTRFLGLANFGDDTNGLASSEVQAKLPSAAGTYSLMSIFVSANTASTATLTFRKNGAAGNQTISIGSGATGWFQDVTNSDTVVDGDLVDLRLVTGANITYKGVYSCMFSVAGAAAITYLGQGGEVMSTDFSGGNQDYFWGGNAGLVATTELATKLTIRAAGAFTKLSILGNTAAQVPHIRSRLNGADGTLDIAQGTGTDGVLQTDSTHTDSVVSGDTWGLRTSTSGSRRWSTVFVRFTSSSTKFDLVSAAGPSTLGSGTHYIPIMGQQPATQETTEANANAKAPAAIALSKLRVTVGTNGLVGGSQVFTLRKNGADGASTITVPVTTTGLFEDATHSDTLAAGDLVCVKCVGSNSSGSTQFVQGILADMVTTTTETAVVTTSLSGISQQINALETDSVAITTTLRGISQEVNVSNGHRGTITTTLQGVSQEVDVSNGRHGVITTTLRGVSQLINATETDLATIQTTLRGISQAVIAVVTKAPGTGRRQFWTS